MSKRSSTRGGVTTISINDFRTLDDDERHRGRLGGSASKSKAAKRKKVISEQRASVKKAKAKREEEEAKKEGKAKRKRRRKETEVSNTVKHKKKRSSKKEEDASPAPKKKRRRRTTGELLRAGKTKAAQRRLQGSASKALKVIDSTDLVDANEVTVLEGDLMPVIGMDFTTEGEFLSEYKHIYDTQSEIIRKLEKKLVGDEDVSISSRDVYALSTMYSQMRETISDMRSIKDMGTQAENLAVNIFDPAMKASGESLINLYFKVTTSIRRHVKDPKLVSAILEKLKQDVASEGVSLQNQLNISRSKIIEILSET